MKPSVRIFSFGRAAAAHQSLVAAMRGFCARTSKDADLLRYESEVQRYQHQVCTTLRGLFQGLSGALPMGAIGLWVVESTSEIHPEERVTLQLFRRLGVREVMIFVQSGDPDDDAIDLTEVELREALLEAGFSGDEASIVRGDTRDAIWGPNARSAASALLELFDAKGPQSSDCEAPLVGLVRAANYQGRGLPVYARLLRGRLLRGARISVFSGFKLREGSINELFRGDEPVDEIVAPDDFYFRLASNRAQLERNSLLTLAGQLALSVRVEVELFVFPYPKGRTPPKRPPNERFTLAFPYGQAEVTLDEGELWLGALSVIVLRAIDPFVMAPGFLCELRSKKEVLALGVVLRSLG